MTTYTVQRRVDGEVVHAYSADAATEWPEYPFSDFNHIPEKITAPVPIPRELTKLEYLRRFTGEERITIRTAAKQNAVLEDYLAMLDLAQDINLDDADTVAAVGMLEQAGLIAAGRASEVLA